MFIYECTTCAKHMQLIY